MGFPGDPTGEPPIFSFWHGVQILELESALLAVVIPCRRAAAVDAAQTTHGLHTAGACAPRRLLSLMRACHPPAHRQDPLIDGLPYIDWSVSGDDPERVLGRLLGSAGVGVGVGVGSEEAQTLPDDYASAWPLRNLLIPTDGSFAWWPVHSHDSVGAWRATQPEGVSAAFSEALWQQIEARVMTHGQFRTCTYKAYDDAMLPGKVPYLVRRNRTLDLQYPFSSALLAAVQDQCTRENDWAFSDCVEDKTVDCRMDPNTLESGNCTITETEGARAGDHVPIANPHETGHIFLGGDMAAGGPGPLDPAFFFHHGYFDKQRVNWQDARVADAWRGWGLMSKEPGATQLGDGSQASPDLALGFSPGQYDPTSAWLYEPYTGSFEAGKVLNQVTDSAPTVSTVGSLEATRRRPGPGLRPTQLPSPTRGRGACSGGSIGPRGLSPFGRCGRCAHCLCSRSSSPTAPPTRAASTCRGTATWCSRGDPPPRSTSRGARGQ